MTRQTESTLESFERMRLKFLDLREALADERKLGRRIFEIVVGGGSPSVTEGRLWWSSVARVHACLRAPGLEFRTANQNLSLAVGEFFEFSSRQQTVAEALAVGDTDHYFLTVRRRGTKPLSVMRGLCIDWAFLYVAMARAGRIADRYCIKSVSAAFGVGRTTAQYWARNHQPTNLILGYRGHLSPELVATLMRQFGQEYRDRVAGNDLAGFDLED